MNWLLVGVILLVAAYMVWGYCRGFLRVAYSIAEWILIFVIVTWATPYVSSYIINNTQLAHVIEEKCIEEMKERVADGDAAEPVGDLGHAQLQELGISLPESVTEKLLDVGTATDHVLTETGVYESIASKISALAIQGISFLVVFVVAFLICRIASVLLNIVDKIPVINGVNRSFGVIAGFIKAFLVIWVLFAIIAVCAGTEVGRFLVSYINEAPVLQWLYENNLVLSILMYFFF